MVSMQDKLRSLREQERRYRAKAEVHKAMREQEERDKRELRELKAKIHEYKYGKIKRFFGKLGQGLQKPKKSSKKGTWKPTLRI